MGMRGMGKNINKKVTMYGRGKMLSITLTLLHFVDFLNQLKLMEQRGQHSTVVVYALPTQLARVRFPAFPNFFRGKI